MSQYPYFLHNGDILPVEQAAVPLNNIEYSYGFGVYETIRVSGGVIYFLEQHCARLMGSASAIGLEHELDMAAVEQAIRDLVDRNKAETCNLKVLLIGGRTAAQAHLYITCLNPLFPDRKLYRDGAHCITVQYEREYPHAKTLNMLPSYLAYRQAREAGAYDALLLNRRGEITEGTRTNFYGVRGRTIISPPLAEILPGVTRDNVLKVAKGNDFQLIEKPIPFENITDYDGMFLTSTSSKIMPISSINDQAIGIPAPLLDLMKAYDDFLSDYQ